MGNKTQNWLSGHDCTLLSIMTLNESIHCPSSSLIKSLPCPSPVGSHLPLTTYRSIWAFLLLHSDGYGWLIYIDL